MQGSTTDQITYTNDRPQGLSTEAKMVLMQQQLALLLHADHCERLERRGMATNCMDRNCGEIRNLLPHLQSCTREKECNVPHCISSKYIMRHYRSCGDMECKVCSAIRKPIGNSTPSSASSVSCPQNGLTSNHKSDISSLNGIKISDSPLPHQKTAFTTGPCESQPTLVLNGEFNRVPLHESRITDQQRELAMKKFVNDISLSIFPTANPTAYSDPRMKQFLDYVKRMEKDVFVKSRSTEEYFKTMALHYHNIHSELKEKRRLRESCPPLQNGDISDVTQPSELSNSVSSENSLKTNSYDQDQFSDALEIVSKREEQIQREIKVEVATESSSNSSDSAGVLEDKDNKEDSNSPEVKYHPVASVEPSESDTKTKIDEKTDLESDAPEPTGSDEKKTDAQASREPIRRRIWYSNELLQHFLPVVLKISKEKDAEPFLTPVDWKFLEIYDYPQIVSDPMDLSTIRRKLEDREYKDPWEIVDDFWLMLNNAWLYNKKTSKVYKTCTRLAETFETIIDPVMQSLGFCCGREYYYQPPTLTCLTPKFCTIYRDAVYYVYKSDGQTPGLLEQKYTVCERCYNEALDQIALDSDSSNPVNVQKSLMEKCKNDIKEKEPFVFCKHCGRKWHRVCAIYLEEIWPDGFICNHCIVNYGLKRVENRFTAKKLTTCKLSNFLEKRVNDFLKKKEADAGDVIIRVLAAADKTVEVKSGMKARFCDNGEMPESFPYRVKAIFAFQEIDGQEVCFFGLHVQEYGSECPLPNTRRVYVAYLDSVYFFRPKQFRTEIYHELLVGYIHYAKLLGFTMAHIWACPPSEGDDYIFHMHPPDQKIPKPKRLQEWYQKMLKKALIERIVVDYKDICQDANESHMISPSELAYFEGDFWPNTLEEIFKEMDEEDAKRKQEQEALARGDDDDEAKENVQTKETDENPGKKKAKRRKLKRSASITITGKRKRLGGIGSGDVANEVARRVYEIMEKHKENFFVIRLHPQNSVAALPPIKDPDPLINSELMECRGAFLEKAREKHLEFSSLRRAKYSTLVMLYELHNENRQPLMYTCNVCSAQLETPWHCKQCIEYDLCPRCYETENHPHPMVKIGIGLDDCNKGQEPSNDSTIQESGRDKLSRWVKALGHSCYCRDANCRVYACKTMKYQVQHFRVHSTDRNQCSVCRFIYYLCCYHSKTCHELKCLVPLCPKLKAKMKQQQKQQRLKQTQMLRRRMATMQRCNSMTPNHQPTPPPSQNYQQCSQSSTSDCISSPMSVPMQSSPFASTAVTTVSYNLTSPHSRSQSSIQSPQQSPFFHPPCPSSYQNSQQTVHSSKAYVSSPSIPRSPSISAMPVSTCVQNLPQSTGTHNQPAVTLESDQLINTHVDISRTGYAFQSQSKYSSSCTQPTTSFSTQQQLQRHHIQERPQTSLNNNWAPNYVVSQHSIQSHGSTSGHSVAHRPLLTNNPVPIDALSPKPFVHQPCVTPMDVDPSYPQQIMSSRFQGENEHNNYIFNKQSQQQSVTHHPSPAYSQVIEGHNPGTLLPPSQTSSGTISNSNWRQPGTAPPGSTMYPSGSSVSSTQPNTSIVRSGSMQPTSSQSIVSTTSPNIGVAVPCSISPEDVRIVQQAYTTMRQRGAPALSMPSMGLVNSAGMSPNRAVQPSPHYSSVMLSQLLGPGQTANLVNTPSSVSEYPNMPNKQHLVRQEFIPSTVFQQKLN
ncbi:putative creb-binding protein 2 [Schistosoma mansoni]|uniref:putative creb-binding protein 2 n=1 Tax=Schistosoma mansoni TaxID=6183 RepID=UPI00022DC6EE|nr:putative creb-binding protein 2 [Schistosoma mansoni]|eukprot:XP_018651827.1 putative creb-binding protein 2 [Schistosoma mansoni]